MVHTDPFSPSPTLLTILDFSTLGPFSQSARVGYPVSVGGVEALGVEEPGGGSKGASTL